MKIRYEQLRFCTWFYSEDFKSVMLRTDEMLGNDYLCTDLYGSTFHINEHTNVQKLILTEKPRFKLGGIG